MRTVPDATRASWVAEALRRTAVTSGCRQRQLRCPSLSRARPPAVVATARLPRLQRRRRRPKAADKRQARLPKRLHRRRPVAGVVGVAAAVAMQSRLQMRTPRDLALARAGCASGGWWPEPQCATATVAMQGHAGASGSAAADAHGAPPAQAAAPAAAGGRVSGCPPLVDHQTPRLELPPRGTPRSRCTSLRLLRWQLACLRCVPQLPCGRLRGLGYPAPVPTSAAAPWAHL